MGPNGLLLAFCLCVPRASAGLSGFFLQIHCRLADLALWLFPDSAAQILAGPTSFLISKHGSLYACGSNELNEAGLSQAHYACGSANQALHLDRMTQVPLKSVKQVATSALETLFLLQDGRVLRSGAVDCGANCSAWDPQGRHGLAGSRPRELPWMGAVRQVAQGSGFSLFLMEGGEVYAMGANDNGQLGTGDRLRRSEPTKVKGLSAVEQVVARAVRSLFLLKSGEVLAAGGNRGGRLGTGGVDDVLTPEPIKGLKEVVEVAAGLEFSLFLRRDGRVFGLGEENFGQLGGGPGERIVRKAREVRGVRGVKHVAAGFFSSFFLMGNGSVWVLGHNGGGLLGKVHVYGSVYEVKELQGLPRPVARVSADYGSALFLTEDGQVWGLGNGELCMSAGDGGPVTEPMALEGFGPGWSLKGMVAALLAPVASCCWGVWHCCLRALGWGGQRLLEEEGSDLQPLLKLGGS